MSSLSENPAIRLWLQQHKGALVSGSDTYYASRLESAIADGSLPIEQVQAMSQSTATADREQLVKDLAAEVTKQLTGNQPSTGPNPADVFSNIRVKAGSESYLATKSIATHKRSGQQVFDDQGRPCMTTSELEYAKAGVLFKKLASRSGIGVVLTENEHFLFNEMIEKDTWCGFNGREWVKGLSGVHTKALLNDTTSGGIFTNPEWFDQALITRPLLSGELLPMVDLREVPRGSSVETASVGNPSVIWGVHEGTSMALFDTDGLVAEIDTSIFPVAAVVEVGRDFLSDAAVDVGRVLMDNIGERLKAELDKVIAYGNGTSQPQGIFLASGTNSVTFGGTAAEVADYESLLFAIGKQYRTSNRCAFVSNDVCYRRCRSIPVDASNDARRIFGMSHEDYTILNRPYKIQNDLPNTHVAFGDLAKYRLYRRAGFSMEIVTGGDSLARRNVALVVVRGRFGGRVMDSNAFAVATDAQA